MNKGETKPPKKCESQMGFEPTTLRDLVSMIAIVEVCFVLYITLSQVSTLKNEII